jgi:hypothetical protein
MGEQMSGNNQNQCIYLEDSLETAQRLREPQPVFSLPQHIANLRTVLLNPENGIVQRRASFTALERSGEPAAAAVLKEFTASCLRLDEPKVVKPTSPKHPKGVVTGAVD